MAADKSTRKIGEAFGRSTARTPRIAEWRKTRALTYCPKTSARFAKCIFSQKADVRDYDPFDLSSPIT
jgi:hypothetical protein